MRFPEKTRRRLFLLRRIFLCLLPGLVAVLIICLGRIDPAKTDAVYSMRIFPVVSAVIGLPARVVPFSIVSVLLWSILPLMICGLIALIVLLRRSQDRFRTLRRAGAVVLFLLSLIFFFFAITCAPNFNRLTFAQLSGLEVRGSTRGELAALCAELIIRTNEARASVEEQDGIFAVGESFSSLSSRSLAAFNELAADYPFLKRCAIAPKAMLGSEVLSAVEVTGFYSCFTAEPTVNVHMPDLELPFTMCHELAHTGGILREDEANFIGYLVCVSTDDPAMRYSGLICALNYAMGRLYTADPQTYLALRAYYAAGVERDLAYSGKYWEKYANKAPSQAYSAVNDTVLKLNDQTDGRQSYGRMVDLLLADYRARHGLT